MIDTILMFCALVVAIQIIRYLWNWTTGILSGREERERLERENKTLTYQVKNLEAKNINLDIIFFGHWQKQKDIFWNGVRAINPGALENGINFAVFDTVTKSVEFVNENQI
ncbi:MAG: hypothetical protein UR80_C0014G0002 [Parcubacteria group bacterium GW2011_GWB1_35_5]|nr:MAG: hypothetical protein UR80_C0014G0002 [Parcubacteria group bacterium GW2011_GWB1_35_5]